VEKTKLLAGTGMGSQLVRHVFQKKNQVHVTIGDKNMGHAHLSRKFDEKNDSKRSHTETLHVGFWKSLLQ